MQKLKSLFTTDIRGPLFFDCFFSANNSGFLISGFKFLSSFFFFFKQISVLFNFFYHGCMKGKGGWTSYGESNCGREVRKAGQWWMLEEWDHN